MAGAGDNGVQIRICKGTKCMQRIGQQHLNAVERTIRHEVEANGLSAKVQIGDGGCFDLCKNGCAVAIAPDDVVYQRVTPEVAAAIVRRHIMRGEVLDDHVGRRKGDSLWTKLVTKLRN